MINNHSDDLEILIHHDLVELCRKRTEQRDALAAAMRLAINEVRVLRGEWLLQSMIGILTSALTELDRTDENERPV